jgi:hypothetical protein
METKRLVTPLAFGLRFRFAIRVYERSYEIVRAKTIRTKQASSSLLFRI